MMMKYILFVSIIISNNIFSQDSLPKKQFIQSINLISWNNKLNQNQISRYLEHNNDKVLIQSINSKNKVEWELIKVDTHKYQYSEYETVTKKDSSNEEKTNLIKRGYLIVSNFSYPIDSFKQLDMETFKEISVINLEKTLVKHGDWFEKIGKYRYQGKYINGKKEGKWNCTNYENEIDEIYEITYKNGVEIDKWSKNFAFQPNKDTLQKYLTGTWILYYQNSEKINFLYKKKGGTTLIFKENGEYIMLNKYIETLKKVRKGVININDFCYSKKIDTNNYSYDANALKRYQLLIAFQYNRKKSDEVLLAKLIKSEILMNENATFQGLSSSLELNSYLLSQFNKPEYSLFFLKAKAANFDTRCGFDSEYLLSAGIKKTYQYIKTTEKKYSNFFYEIFGKTQKKCCFSNLDIEKWKIKLDNKYPNKLEFKSIEEEIELAIELNEFEILKKRIKTWKKSINVWNESKLQRISYYSDLIKDKERQIWANEEILKLKHTDWDKASQLETLSKLYLKAKSSKKAWKRIKKANQLLRKNRNWKKLGLGRFIMERTFEIIIIIDNPNDKIAQKALKTALKEIKGMKNLHINLLEKIIKSGKIMGNKKLINTFSKILKVERKNLTKY